MRYINHNSIALPSLTGEAVQKSPSQLLALLLPPRAAQMSSLRVPMRPSAVDLASKCHPNAKKRPQRASRRARDAIFHDFGSILKSIFFVCQSCIVRASQLAARRTKPLFLLAGAVLERVCPIYDKTKNRQTASKNRSDNVARTSRARIS